MEQKHVYTSAHVRILAGAQLAQFLRDAAAAEGYAKAVISLSDQHWLPNWRPHATVQLGWALGQADRLADAINLVQQGIASFDAGGAVGYRLQYAGIAAELHARLGNHSTSLRLIEETHKQMQEREHLFWYAELCRIEGEVRRRGAAHRTSRPALSRRSSGPGSNKPSHSNCARQRASPDFGATRAGTTTPVIFWRRSTNGSPRGSTRPT